MAIANNERDRRLKDLEQITKDLEAKSVQAENGISDLKTTIDNLSMNVQMQIRDVPRLKERVIELEDHDENHEERLKQLEQDMKDAQNKLLLAGGSGGDGVDADALTQLLDNLRNEFDEKYTAKDAFNDLVKRVEQLETDRDSHASTLDTHTSEIEELKKKKVSTDTFETEINYLKQLLASGAGKDVQIPSGPGFSPSEMAVLKRVINVWPDWEDTLAALINDLKNLNLGAIKDAITDLQEKMGNKADRSELGPIKDEINTLKDLLNSLKQDLESLKNSSNNSGGSPDAGRLMHDLAERMAQVENKLNNLSNKHENLEKKVALLARNPGNNTGGASDLDLQRLDELEKNFNDHLNDYNKFKDEVIRMLTELQNQLNNKVDHDKMSDLERLLMEKLQETNEHMLGRMADKKDTKKNLKQLEVQLRNIAEAIMQRSNNPNEDDAMFSKRPLGGFSCASCEKNLINLNGKPPEFYNWNRFPPRDPNERMARVGQGFSRMLSSMKPNPGHSVKPQNQYLEEQPEGQGPRTQQHFYQQDAYQNRPVSAQVLPGIKEQK